MTDNIAISCRCERRADRFVYTISIEHGRRKLKLTEKNVPDHVDSVCELLHMWSQALTLLDELEKKRHLAELGPYKAGRDIYQRLRLQTELDNHHFAAIREARASAERARECLEAELKALPLESPLIIDSVSQYYVLHERVLWASRRRFSKEQWLGLISQYTAREQAKLASLTWPRGSHLTPLKNREAIPSEVRVEVWRRDDGRCSRCGSRERLEFDHIIPITLGGGNTARNIELLCQACNRAKGALIT